LLGCVIVHNYFFGCANCSHVPDIKVINGNGSRPTSGDLWCIGVIIVAWHGLIKWLTAAHPIAHMLSTSHYNHAYTTVHLFPLTV